VTSSDVLHLHARHPGATIAGDLADAPHIASPSFDSIILTQTLQYVFDVDAAMAAVRRLLAPGGVLPLSVPGLSRTSDAAWHDRWMWNFTSRSVRRLAEAHFDGNTISVEGHGNVFVALAFLHGLAVQDVGEQRLQPPDPGYEIVITARAST
jgi:SAM-dependent methyltransferase